MTQMESYGVDDLRVAQAKGLTSLAVTLSKWLICEVRAPPDLHRATAAARPTGQRQGNFALWPTNNDRRQPAASPTSQPDGRPSHRARG